MRDEPEAGVTVPNCALTQTPQRVLSIKTAGRWSWKSKSAKECVTTHLPNQLAPKMDGAEARDPHPAIGGERQAPMSRRARRSPQNPGASPGGAAVGADLGGSSKYSNENFEGRRGE
ncbi:unnamed protein product, partial [Musa hybrid cultivar]